ncbi:MAG TPA: response regulator [Thermoanaerobaculia bacterium]|nr:response regulator [Thermoanaerobaculia bacterium]
MAKAKILVIDDDDKALGIAKRQLEAAGYEVITEESALKLPVIVQREKPDLVLLDVEMPALRGEHVLELSAMFDFLRTIPIVLHSAKSDEELQALVAKSHARGYIRKGNNPLAFAQQVERFVLDTRPDGA